MDTNEHKCRTFRCSGRPLRLPVWAVWRNGHRRFPLKWHADEPPLFKAVFKPLNPGGAEARHYYKLCSQASLRAGTDGSIERLSTISFRFGGGRLDAAFDDAA